MSDDVIHQTTWDDFDPNATPISDQPLLVTWLRSSTRAGWVETADGWVWRTVTARSDGTVTVEDAPGPHLDFGPLFTRLAESARPGPPRDWARWRWPSRSPRLPHPPVKRNRRTHRRKTA